jgi:hypothetical protein
MRKHHSRWKEILFPALLDGTQIWNQKESEFTDQCKAKDQKQGTQKNPAKEGPGLSQKTG